MIRHNSSGAAALIVAHGQPSDPEPAEAALAALAAEVAGHLPDWQIGSATLATRGALGRAMAGFGGRMPLVYPFFMAEGWFTRTNLPRILASAGAAEARVLAAFGTDPALHALVVRRVREAVDSQGWSTADTTLILAAHGARKGAGPAQAIVVVADAVRAALRFRDLRVGFIEEAPHLADSAYGAGAEAICLPLFAAAGGHVSEDIPAALRQAGFGGVVLAPIGTDAETPGLIAAALIRGWTVREE